MDPDLRDYSDPLLRVVVDDHAGIALEMETYMGRGLRCVRSSARYRHR